MNHELCAIIILITSFIAIVVATKRKVLLPLLFADVKDKSGGFEICGSAKKDPRKELSTILKNGGGLALGCNYK